MLHDIRSNDSLQFMWIIVANGVVCRLQRCEESGLECIRRCQCRCRDATSSTATDTATATTTAALGGGGTTDSSG
jgi:hypothetical protein